MTDYSKAPGEPMETPPPDDGKIIERVTVSEVIMDGRPQKIRNKMRRLFGGADLKTAMKYAALEVALPSFRDTVADIGHSIVDQMFSPGRGRGRGYHRGMGRRPFDDPRDARPRFQYSSSTARRGGHLPDQDPRYSSRSSRYGDFREVTLTSRRDAERILDEMLSIIDRYGKVTVADFYECTGLPPIPTDHKWGWYSLRRVDIYETREGYKIDFPAAEPV